MKLFTILFLSFFLTIQLSHSQTRKVREKVAEDKKASSSRASSSSEPSWEPDFDEGGLGEIIVGAIAYVTVYAVYKGLWHSQHAIMNRYDDYPELISFQGTLANGFNFSDNGFAVIPSLRGNYGLFATDLRYVNMSDITGRLQSIDWQVLMFRVPVKNLRLEYGLGFSHVMSPSKTYFDSSLGFDGDFLNYAINIQGQYRWSQKTSFGSRYRQEYSIEAGLQVAQSGWLRVVPFVGYSHFNYFNEIDFKYLKAGIKLRIF